MSHPRPPKLYPITDTRLSGLTHAEQLARLAEGGATFVQLREKHASPREFYEQAAEAVRVARALGVRVIVNDRADIALAVGADGVHLGQDDLDPEAARRLLGERFIIGYSTHSVGQAAEAARLPVDYLAVGPIFETSSKERPGPTVGLEGLRRVRAAVGSVPLVAIGGVTRATARAVLEAGADSLALISSLVGGDPAGLARRTSEFLSLIKEPPDASG